MATVLKEEIQNLIHEADLLSENIRNRASRRAGAQDQIIGIPPEEPGVSSNGGASVWSRFRGFAKRYGFIR